MLSLLPPSRYSFTSASRSNPWHSAKPPSPSRSGGGLGPRAGWGGRSSGAVPVAPTRGGVGGWRANRRRAIAAERRLSRNGGAAAVGPGEALRNRWTWKRKLCTSSVMALPRPRSAQHGHGAVGVLGDPQHEILQRGRRRDPHLGHQPPQRPLPRRVQRVVGTDEERLLLRRTREGAATEEAAQQLGDGR